VFVLGVYTALPAAVPSTVCAVVRQRVDKAEQQALFLQSPPGPRNHPHQ
jgi:hypothetical protein